MAANGVIEEFLEAEKKLLDLLSKGGVVLGGNITTPNPPLILDKQDEETIKILFWIFVGVLAFTAFVILINCLTSLCTVCGTDEYDDFPLPIEELPLEVESQDQSRRELGMTMKPAFGYRNYSSIPVNDQLRTVTVDSRNEGNAVPPIRKYKNKTNRKSGKSKSKVTVV